MVDCKVALCVIDAWIPYSMISMYRLITLNRHGQVEFKGFTLMNGGPNKIHCLFLSTLNAFSQFIFQPSVYRMEVT